MNAVFSYVLRQSTCMESEKSRIVYDITYSYTVIIQRQAIKASHLFSRLYLP